MNELKEHINENGINYTLCGDYYIPDWQIPVTDRTLGHYGRMRKAYLQTQRPVLYAGYVAHGTLFEHCAEVETQARQRLDVMMEQIAQEWGISEEMKSTDPLGWAGLMNQARHCADEVILNELIYC